MKIGAHDILITNPRDMPAFIEELKKHRFTAMIGVNTLYNALLNAPGFAEVDRATSRWPSPAAWPCSARSPRGGSR